MEYIVEITCRFDDKKSKTEIFQNWLDAYTFFAKWCDEKGVNFEPNATTAGGFFEDYLISINEINP